MSRFLVCSALSFSLIFAVLGRNGENAERHATHRISDQPRRETHQLDVWLGRPETHEQAMVGERTSRTFAKTMHFLEEIERKADGVTK